MLTRRGFAGCAVCAAVGLAATGVKAQPAQTPGITRTVLQSTDLNDTHMTVLVRLEVAPGTPIARHTHPRIESFYILEGELEFSAQGQPDKVVKAGEGGQVPPYTPHGGRAGGDRPMKAVITYVVEKGKPLASPA
ncbi:MAG: cupin domain-containing protein [Acetobacteraceae bacterium]|nr:cupin domain-containing protein [Acetobacteraceae bacterium]